MLKGPPKHDDPGSVAKTAAAIAAARDSFDSLDGHAVCGTAPSADLKTVKDEFREAVGRGEIPDTMLESWMLVDPNSDGGRAFHQEWLGLAKELYAKGPVVDGRNKANEQFAWLYTHDFDKEPVVFIRSTLPEANAWYVKGSVPIMIVICDGLTVPSSRNKGSPPIQQLENAFDIVGHEMTHGKLHNRFGHKWNSKFEEAIANAVPARLLHYMGLDPRTVLDLDQRLNALRPKVPMGFQDLVDPHPVKPTMKSLYNAALTEIRGTIGGVSVGAVVGTPLTEELRTLPARAGSYTSWLSKQLTGTPKYQEMPPRQKVEALLNEVAAAIPPFTVRFREIGAELNKLGKVLDVRTDVELIDRAVDSIFELMTAHRDFVNIDETKSTTGAMILFRALTVACGVEPMSPVGTRLTRVADPMQELVQNGEAEDEGGIRAASAKVLAAIDGDPFIKDPQNHQFIRYVGLPTFEMPDLDPLERRKIVKPPWRKVAQMALDNPEVALAAVAIGLLGDAKVESGVKTVITDATLAGITQPNFSLHDVRPAQLSMGPRSADNTMLHLVQDDRGVITGTTSSPRDVRLQPPSKTIAEDLITRIDRGTLGELNCESLSKVLKSGGIFLDGVVSALLKRDDVEVSEELLKILLNYSSLTATSGSRESQHEILANLAAALEAENPTAHLVLESILNFEMRLVHRLGRDGEARTNEYGDLSLFLQKIAPHLSKARLLEVFNGSGGDWHFEHGSTAIKNAVQGFAIKHLGYPKKQTWSAVTAWVKTLDCTRIGADVGHGGSSLAMELARSDISKLVGTARTPISIAAVADLARLSFSEADGDGFFAAEKLYGPLSKRIAKLERFDDSLSLPERASAWQAIAGNDAKIMLAHDRDRFLEQILTDIEGETNQEVRLAASTALLKGQRIESPELRKLVIDQFVDAAAQTLGGLDDETPAFRERVREILLSLRESVPLVDLRTIGDKLGRRIESQKDCSFLIEDIVHGSGEDRSKKLFLLGALGESLLEAARRNPGFREELVKYLLSDASDSEVRLFCDTATTENFFPQLTNAEILNPKDKTDKPLVDAALAQLRSMHKDFWLLPLELRSIFARELLPPEGGRTINATLSYVVDKVLPSDMKFRDETSLRLEQYVHALPDESKHLALAALLTAGEPGQNKATISAGKVLVSFAESMGPAEIKFVQALMDSPGLDPEFRADLLEHGRHLKYRAKEPTRADIFRWVAVVEAKEGRSFGRIGSLCGCGSINVVMRNKGKLLCLRRPNAVARGEDGFGTMLRMIDSMESTDPLAAWLRPIVDQAQKRMALEGNFTIAKQQYDLGRSNYKDYEVVVDGEVTEFDATDVSEGGEDFYIMSEIEGEHFVDLLEAAGETIPIGLRRTAKGILCREFNNIVRGVFDCDRHGGQIKHTPGKVGHFDFKAMSLEEWPIEGHQQFAKILTGVVFSTGSSKDIAENFLQALEGLRTAGEPIHPFVTEAQKALVSLGDYFSAINPATTEELLQIVIPALTFEVPEAIKEVYIDAIAANAVAKLPQEHIGLATAVKGLVKTVLDGDPVPGFISAMAPNEVRPLLTMNRNAVVLRHKTLAA